MFSRFFSTKESFYVLIEEELKKLPGKPGVYIMHGEKDEIIYVERLSV